MVFAGGFLMVLTVVAEAQNPYGDQFLVSDVAFARNPAVAMDEAGNSVVVWAGQHPISSGVTIWARLYDTNGIPRGEAIQVTPADDRWLPRVAMARNGRFVVIWAKYPGGLVEARVYLADGTPVTDPLVVSDLHYGLWEKPADVDIADNGVFLVVWDSNESPDPTADGMDILARRFEADGTPSGSVFQVNSHTSGLQKHPRVAMNYEGRKVGVVWESEGSPGNDQWDTCVLARVFDNDLPLGLDFQVNETTPDNQRDPSIDMNADPDNRIVIVWESEVAGGWWGIFGRRYLVDGTATDGEVRLDEWPYGFFLIQEDPAVALTSQRDILVAWESHSTFSGDDPDRSVEGRYSRFDGTWSPEFQVNNVTVGYQTDAAIAVNDRGDHVVVWSDESGVWARRYRPVDPIFVNGFESGDTSGWN